MTEHALRDAEPADLELMRALLNREIRESTATWTTVERSAEAMRAWWEARRADGHATLVAMEGDRLLGFAGYGRFRTWPGYSISAESSVYIAGEARRRGIGRALLTALAERARAGGLINLVAVIGADREASLALHAACGYREVGRLPGVGEKFGRRLDMVMMQLTL